MKKKEKEKVVLKNDLTDFTDEEFFEFKDIKKLLGVLKNISATKFLRDIISIVADIRDYSIIKNINKSSILKQKFELLDDMSNF